MLQSQLLVLTERVNLSLRQAYGLAQKQEGVVDLSSRTIWSPSRTYPICGPRSARRWSPPPATWSASCLPSSTPRIPIWTPRAQAGP